MSWNYCPVCGEAGKKTELHYHNGKPYPFDTREVFEAARAARLKLKEGVTHVHARTEREIDKLLLEHGATRAVLEDRHKKAIDHILDAASMAEAEEFSKKAYGKLHISLLVANKTKITPESLEDQAKGADYFVKVNLEKAEQNPLQKSRYLKYAKTQEARAARLRDTADKMRRGEPLVEEMPKRRKKRA